MSIKPYKIAVPDEAITHLKTKLAAATFPEPNSFSDDWTSGAPLSDVKRLAERWGNGYDWREHEARLNEELPQFTTPIDVDGFGEINIHFVHHHNKNKNSIPLLFCHGWPGSFLEVRKIFPLLVQSEEPSFHIVAPSLPNFGFSDRVDKTGFGMPQYAETMHKLMRKLGYDKYVTQGGDWGYSITRHMALMFPESCVAHHINMIYFPAPPAATSRPWDYIKQTLLGRSKWERDGLERSAWFNKHGYGYNLLQATRPATLGLAMHDSPVAVLSWIYEKLHDWTDSYPWDDDEALTWISIYQFSTAGPAASFRIYYEARNAPDGLRPGMFRWIGGSKLGISYFPRDITVPPAAWGRTLGPVVFERMHDSGGHFAAYEVPEKLVGDVKDMFRKGGGADFGGLFAKL